MSTHPKNILPYLCLLLAGRLSQGLAADPLPPAQFLVEARAGLVGSPSQFGFGGFVDEVPLNFNLDVSGVYEGGGGPILSYDIQAQAEAFGGVRPQAVATVEAHGTPMSSNAAVQGYAFASIVYYMRVVSLGGAFPAISSVPVQVNILQDLSGSGGVITQLDDEIFRLASLSGHLSRDLTYTKYFNLDQIATIKLSANATAVDNYGIGPARPTSSQALADPLFVFDQATFDATMGPNTFPLTDYFSFEYSPGAELVPEPSSIALGLAGVAGLAFRRTRNDRSA